MSVQPSALLFPPHQIPRGAAGFSTPIANEFVTNPPFNNLDIDISYDADWHDGFVIMEDERRALNLTGATLQLYTRPFYNSPTLYFLLSTGNGTIQMDDPVGGMAYFNMSRDNIAQEFPIGEWAQYMVLHHQGLYSELWRGFLRVHPGLP